MTRSDALQAATIRKYDWLYYSLYRDTVFVTYRAYSSPSQVHYYRAAGRGAKYCGQRVCMSVCPLACLKNHSQISQSCLYIRYQWP